MNNLPTILLMTFVLVPHYLATLLFSKVSMLTFYLRVFETHKLRIWALSTIGVCVAWFIAHLLANIFICSPVEAQWKMELLISGEGVCQEQVPLFQSMIITNMLIDLIIMALPLSKFKVNARSNSANVLSIRDNMEFTDAPNRKNSLDGLLPPLRRSHHCRQRPRSLRLNSQHARRFDNDYANISATDNIGAELRNSLCLDPDIATFVPYVQRALRLI